MSQGIVIMHELHQTITISSTISLALPTHIIATWLSVSQTTLKITAKYPCIYDTPPLPLCAMLSRSAMSHNPLDCCSLFKCRDDFQCFSLLDFSWWGSEEPALWWVNDRALHQVNPNGYNIRKRRKVLCLEIILEIRKFLARKCFEQLMYPGITHQISYPLPRNSTMSSCSDLRHSLFYILPIHTMAVWSAGYWIFGKLVIWAKSCYCSFSSKTNKSNKET